MYISSSALMEATQWPGTAIKIRSHLQVFIQESVNRKVEKQLLSITALALTFSFRLPGSSCAAAVEGMFCFRAAHTLPML